jgi:branched-chain amino acid transport system ATP-binding protein
MSKLQIRNLRTGYDKVDVLHDVSIDVAPGKITCILGANGAGKSTLIRSILGLTLPRAGQVLWDGADLTGEKTHRIIARGARSFRA